MSGEHVRIVGEEGDRIDLVIGMVLGHAQPKDEKWPMGVYEESTTGLRVCVVLHRRMMVIETLSTKRTFPAEEEYRTEAGQPCFDDEHTDLAKSGPPRILRCPTNSPNVKSPLYLIRQR